MSSFSKNIDDIIPILTAHGMGSKQVFRDNSELNNNLTQIAYGAFNPAEECDEHVHLTMFEYFFFIKGEGVYTVGDEDIKLNSGVFLEIPPKVKHRLIAKGNEKLEFVYWGVAVDSYMY